MAKGCGGPRLAAGTSGWGLRWSESWHPAWSRPSSAGAWLPHHCWAALGYGCVCRPLRLRPLPAWALPVPWERPGEVSALQQLAWPLVTGFASVALQVPCLLSPCLPLHLHPPDCFSHAWRVLVRGYAWSVPLRALLACWSCLAMGCACESLNQTPRTFRQLLIHARRPLWCCGVSHSPFDRDDSFWRLLNARLRAYVQVEIIYIYIYMHARMKSRQIYMEIYRPACPYRCMH